MSPRAWAAVGFGVGTLGAVAWWWSTYRVAIRPGVIAEVPGLVREQLLAGLSPELRALAQGSRLDLVVEEVTRKALEDNLP